MALLFMDGFGGGGDTTTKWDVGSSPYTTQSAIPRVAGGYYGNISQTTSVYKTIPASTKVVMGIGFYTTTTANTCMMFYSDGGATQHITVMRNGAGLLEIRRGNTLGTLLATGTQALALSQWNYVEASVTISDTVGEVHVRLNGLGSDEVSYTGDTKNGGTATQIDRVQFYAGSGGAGSTNAADCYVLNGIGAANNDFLGDVAVRTLSPSGNGTYSQLVGSDGNSVDNYLLVDEHPYVSADYVGSANVGDKDSYLLADLPAGISTVYGVQVAGMMAKNDATLASARYLIRSGGTDYTGTTRALTTTYTGYQELYETDPATSVAWTVGGVNGLEAGVEIQ